MKRGLSASPQENKNERLSPHDGRYKHDKLVKIKYVLSFLKRQKRSWETI